MRVAALGGRVVHQGLRVPPRACVRDAARGGRRVLHVFAVPPRACEMRGLVAVGEKNIQPMRRIVVVVFNVAIGEHGKKEAPPGHWLPTRPGGLFCPTVHQSEKGSLASFATPVAAGEGFGPPRNYLHRRTAGGKPGDEKPGPKRYPPPRFDGGEGHMRGRGGGSSLGLEQDRRKFRQAPILDRFRRHRSRRPPAPRRNQSPQPAFSPA